MSPPLPRGRHPIPVVVVTGGLHFACPFCGRTGHRTSCGTTAHTVPPQHETHDALDRALVRCCVGQTQLFWLVFADVHRVD